MQRIFNGNVNEYREWSGRNWTRLRHREPRGRPWANAGGHTNAACSLTEFGQRGQKAGPLYARHLCHCDGSLALGVASVLRGAGRRSIEGGGHTRPTSDRAIVLSTSDTLNIGSDKRLRPRGKDEAEGVETFTAKDRRTTAGSSYTAQNLGIARLS